MSKHRIILSLIIILRFSEGLVFASSNETLTLTLQKAIDTALCNNETVFKNARNTLRITQRNLIAVRKTYQPKINLDITTQRTTNETELDLTREDKYSVLLNSIWSKVIFNGGLLTLSQGYNLTLQEDKNSSSKKFSTHPYISIALNQPLSKGGKLQQKLPLMSSEENLKLEEINYALIEEDLILNVINNYYQLMRANILVKRAEEQVELSNQLLKWREAKLKIGQIAKLEVMNAKVQLANDEDFLIQAQTQQENLRRNFLRLLGLNENLEIELIGEIKISPLNKEIGESINEAFKNRLEIRKIKIRIEQSKRNIDIAKSTNKPTLTIGGNYNWANEGEKLKDAVTNLPQKDWLAQIKVSFPFFDSGLTKNQMKIANLFLQKELDALENLKKDIVEEITQIYHHIEKNQRRLDVLEATLKIAQETRQISQLKYEMGLVTLREVLETQIAYSKVKNSIDEIKIDSLINLAKLSRARERIKNEYL